MKKNLTEEQLRVLKLICRSELKFNQTLQNTPTEMIVRWVEQYYQEKPIIDDLNSLGININTIEDLIYPELKDVLNEESIQLLAEWLKKESLPYHVKASIIRVMIERPVSKKYIFEVILNIYKTVDRNYRDEWGAKTDLPIMIGNAFQRWSDDEHADVIFSLLENRRFKEDDFLLSSIANFKNPINKKKATKLLINELQQPDLPNAHLGTIISTLRKLQATEARDLIYPFINFPDNYKRTKFFDPKIYGFVSDGEVKSEAKKTIASFDKI